VEPFSRSCHIVFEQCLPSNISSLEHFFAAIFFALVLTVRKKWQNLKTKGSMKNILLATFILGVLYYFIFFFGLKYTSAGNASIMALTEIFFSFLFFNVWRKEGMEAAHIYGALLMILGAVIILYSNFTVFHSGDFLILLASAIAPMGNYFQRAARRQVSSESIMFIRSLISFPTIFLLAYILGNNITVLPEKRALFYLIIIGFLLTGLSKIFWIEAIHRINVATANALSSVGPLFTLFFAWLLLGNIPTKFQLFSFVPMFLGIVLLSRKSKGK
jgi:drug/metabolite transporter (DMT)-like permease